jgi:hypothetical protein
VFLRIPGTLERLNLDLDPDRRAFERFHALAERNPLMRFEPHGCPRCHRKVWLGQGPCGEHEEPQYEFLRASTPVVAAFAGNRFGKTTALVVKVLCQHTPLELLPAHLHPFKFCPEEPVTGRLMVPSEKTWLEYAQPAFQRWLPQQVLKGGRWDHAWSKEHRILSFADGGQMSLYTYQQDPSVGVGVPLHYVAYDEPPPQAWRDENEIRLADYDGRSIYALTPINMEGSGIGWLYRDIWKRREHPDITVVTASIHDNPLLPKDAVARILATYGDADDPQRRSREFGEFTHIGGMVFPGGFEHVLQDPLTVEQLEGREVVVGIDPGLRRAAFVWVAFQDNVAVVFDEQVVDQGIPKDYADLIRRTNLKWGLREPEYVIDPSAKNRTLTGGIAVEALLQQENIFAAHGQNDVEAGVQQMRQRMTQQALKVCSNCRGLRDEADEYRQKPRDDMVFEVVRENNHRLDALRYAVMTRFWSAPELEQEDNLGYRFEHGVAPPMDVLFKPREPNYPMGSMS